MFSWSFIFEVGTRFAAPCLAAVVLAACNAGPMLTTGSLLPSTKPAAPAAPQPAGPIDRAVLFGATSAQAQKCGYYFDPGAFRTNYLAAEAGRGTPPEMLAKSQTVYDYTVRIAAAKIQNSETYCTKDRTAAIKKLLTQGLAGNFEAPPKKIERSAGLFDFFDVDTRPEKFNPDHIYDPVLNEESTKKVEE